MPTTTTGTPYWVDGTGPTLVFLHGVLMDHRSWARQVEDLAGDFRIVRLDMLGHGDSPNPPGARRLEDFVDQVRDVIQLTCPDEAPVLIGFSMGGLIAQAYGIHHSADLRGLVLMNAIYNRTDQEQSAVAARLGNLEANGMAGVIEAARERWFRADEVASQGALIEEVLGWMRDGDAAAKAKAYRVFTTEDHKTAGKLGAITCPALIMTGDGDRGSPPHMSEAMAADIPNARLRVFDRQQHMMPVLDAERVNAELRDFIGTLAGQ